jgi:hypothetical protein
MVSFAIQEGVLGFALCSGTETAKQVKMFGR